MYQFDQIGSDGNFVQAYEVVTYPMKEVNVSYLSVPEPVNVNGLPIEYSLTINTTSYTSNQTIFAWDTIIIDGDLTANTGVEVEISAPVIIMNGGSLGQGITLIEKETPFGSCTSLTAFDPVDLGGYCSNENKYKANQNKNTKLIDDTPIKEKPQTAIAFRSSPNPFTNTFNIEFELETEGETSLIIYDALGRVVETVIVNTTLSIGKHQYQIDGTKLESGLYYATLQTANGTQTIKILKQ